MTTPDTPTLLKDPIILELAGGQLRLVMATEPTAHNVHTLATFPDYYTFNITCNYFLYRQSSFSRRTGAQRRRGGEEQRQDEWREVRGETGEKDQRNQTSFYLFDHIHFSTTAFQIYFPFIFHNYSQIVPNTMKEYNTLLLVDKVIHQTIFHAVRNYYRNFCDSVV